MNSRNTQSGFSMLETLVALSLFSVGFIGVAQFTGEAIKTTADNNTRATSLNTMTQLMAPLYLAASGTKTEFRTAMQLFDGGAVVSGNDNRETYTVTILEAQDNAGVDVLTNTSPDTWLSPVTLGVSVSYTGASGSIVSKAPYTFLIK